MMVQIGLVALLVVGYIVINRIMRSSVELLGHKNGTSEVRLRYVTKMMQLSLTALFIMLACIVMGVGYGQLAVFFSSVFAVVGVALFAQWSILSNITASLIIFFAFPYRVGDWIRVAEKDEDVLGQITDISSFHVIIRRFSGDIVTYPNSLILQKPVVRFDNEAAARAMKERMDDGGKDRPQTVSDNPLPKKP
ncbi:mechanosensitive ion channel family protein [Marinomonas spartinae]|nr:mechanosensitive ion channel family protein [Marinomonas spartinae]